MNILSRHVVIPLLALCTPLIVQAECTPAANPDLNHDGTVGLQDQTIVAYSFGLPADNPRFNPIADTNCDGKVDVTDILFVRNAFGQTFPVPTNLKISSDFDVPNKIRMGPQKTYGMYSVYKLSAHTEDNNLDVNASFHVEITHSIQPDNGLSFLSLPDENLSSEQGSIEHYIDYALKASQEGNYHITTIATVVETGDIHTFETQVQVIDGAEKMPSMGSMSIKPFALTLDDATEVRFSISIVGILPEKIQSVHLHRVGETDKQLMAAVSGSDVYGVSMSIDTTGMQADDCLFFQADVVVENKVYPSEEAEVCVTGFPINADLSALNLIKDSISNIFFVSDELLVRFNEGVSESTMRSIANSVDATIIENLSLGMYRFKLNTTPASRDDIKKVIETLSLLPEVKGAIEHSMTFKLFSSSIVNDPKYDTEQFDFFETTRADEAWYVTRGEQSIAIIDSGVATNHDDLQSKIIGGEDFIVPFGSPDDDNGHGTAVAGIAAAITNNNLGVAGMSWGSHIYAAQVTNTLTQFGLFNLITPIAVSRAIKNTPEEVKIMNISLGTTQETPQLLIDWICEATTEAINDNKLVVAAAGNGGVTNKQYPAACPGVIAVGGVTGFQPRRDTPNRDTQSQHGNWVDLAADSLDVYTTFPPNGCARCDFNYDPAGYGTFGGTSAAAPQVAGALAILKSRHPEMDSKQLLKRLQKSGMTLPKSYKVGKLIDVFEAVFNGDFELVKKGTDEPEEWEQSIGSARACTSQTDYLGETPNHGERMLVCSNAGVVIGGEMNALDIPEGVTELPISFDWKMVSEDLRPTGPAGSPVYTCEEEMDHTLQPPRPRPVCRERFKFHNDYVLMQLVALDNGSKRTEVFKIRLNEIEESKRIPVADRVGTDWQHVSKTIPLPHGTGKYKLLTRVIQSGFDTLTAEEISKVGTTSFIVDRLRFRETDS